MVLDLYIGNLDRPVKYNVLIGGKQINMAEGGGASKWQFSSPPKLTKIYFVGTWTSFLGGFLTTGRSRNWSRVKIREDFWGSNSEPYSCFWVTNTIPLSG